MLSSTVIFKTINSSAVLTVDEADNQQNFAAQARKKRLWLERDSLKSRNQLLVGKEGSRRRQRWDNSKNA
jgi:hypothetical protein